MKKVVIFGAGGTGRELYKHLKTDESIEVVAFADNFAKGHIEDVPILKPNKLRELEYDFIYIETVAWSVVVEELIAIGISQTKMIQSVITMQGGDPRDMFLIRFAEEAYRKKLVGSVAEAGVFRGDFAKQINKNFPDRKLYLFDTFTGFDERDIAYEVGYDERPDKGTHFKETSVDMVISKMQHPENVIIKQGYVPETFHDVEDTFCFVNLDMDLYKPTLEALRFFYPRIVDGGGILIHDYFDTYNFANLKRGVIEFCEESGAMTFPIGDRLSVFVVKR